MKKISVLVPCFNEEENVEPMANELNNILKKYDGKYDYEIIFRDNASTDGSLGKMRAVAYNNHHIKVIANSRNYGTDTKKDSFVGRVSGDVILSIPCDFQEPPELIPDFIEWWEKGYEVVCGKKIGSKEGKIKYGLRQLFYRILNTFSETPQYSNISGIVLMSRKIYDLYSQYNDMYLRYFLADIGCEVKLIQYEQQKRRAGKSSYNIWRYLSFTIESMTSVSVAPLRLATVIGFLMSFVSFIIGIVYLVYKLIFWYEFDPGTAPIVIGMFFLGSVIIFFIGVLGEYVGRIFLLSSKQSPPIVKELINFDNPESDEFLFKSNIHE